MNWLGTSRGLKLLALGLAFVAPAIAAAAASDTEPETDIELSVSSVEPQAQPPESALRRPAASDTWLVFRTGIRKDAAFRIVSAIVEQGRWIQADVGYYDSGAAAEYRLFWAGAGGAVVARDEARLELKAALSRSFGATTEGELHLASNATLSARPRPRWKLEISHTEALPLNRAAARERALDRVRLEYQVGAYQLGVGYAGAQSGSDPWEHRPFVSVSRWVGGVGEVELWLQRVERSDGPTERIQIRFARKLRP